MDKWGIWLKWLVVALKCLTWADVNFLGKNYFSWTGSPLCCYQAPGGHHSPPAALPFGLLAHFLLLLFSPRAPYPLTEPCNPMATSVQTLPLSRGPNKNFRNPFPAPPLSLHCGMGSVGSLVERPDVSPTKTNRAGPQVRPKQTNSLLKKGFTQRELLNYLNITRWVLLLGGCKKAVRCYKTWEDLSSDDLLCFQTEKSLKGTQAPTAKRTLSTGSALPVLGRRTTYTQRSTTKMALR